MRLAVLVVLALAAQSLIGPSPMAATQRPSTWTETKCQRYAAAWKTLVVRRGVGDLDAAFVARHEAFVASGCLAEPDVCPRSPAELDVANAMVIAAMNAGAASTFPPFRCRR